MPAMDTGFRRYDGDGMQGQAMIDRFFRLSLNGTTIRTEIIAGATTYLTMAYIVFVNPVILAEAGMDRGAVFVATCLASALATLLMAFLANYPLAPGMGINAYFTYGVVKGLHYSWEVALGAVFLSGCLFLILSVTRIRSWIVDAIPLSQKMAISAGIGLFLGIIALKDAGLIAASADTLVTLGDLKAPTTLLACAGLFVMAPPPPGSSYSSRHFTGSSRRRRASPRPFSRSICAARSMPASRRSFSSSCLSTCSTTPAR